MGVIDAGISRKERIIYKIARHQGYLPFLLKEKKKAIRECIYYSLTVRLVKFGTDKIG
jgi:hypothetical protein